VTELISQMPPPPRCETEASLAALYSGVILFVSLDFDVD
jgi:hypothetical protein